MAEYWSKYYAFKVIIIEQSIIIEDAWNIWILNKLGPAFKTHLTIVNDWMQKDKKLEEEEGLFKAIKKEKSRIITEQKANNNFTLTKTHYSRLQERGKKNQTKWPLYKKYKCNHLSNWTCRHTKGKCDRCHKTGHISQFHNLYITLSKRHGPEKNDKPVPALEMPKVNCIYLVVTF